MPEHPATPEPAELTLRVVASSSAADIDAVIRLCAADAVWDVHPWGLGTHRGRASIRRFLDGWIGGFDEYRIAVEQILDHGNGVVLALVTQYAGAERSRSRLTLRSASVFVWTDGLLQRVTHHRDIDEGRAAAERLARELGAEKPLGSDIVPLHSIVARARRTFRAQACSILAHEPGSGSLEFAAMSGEGSATLIGVKIPDTTGIAGVALSAREPVFLDDVASDPRFAEDLAETLGYIPKRIIAVPLLHEDRALGVLEILDGLAGAKFTASEREELADFAGQAASALALAAHSS
jgi:ketosteroid isomerase-like protein